MGNKITISELAKLCGCSSATVSYVLNGRDNQRISEATKEKVLQMANLYEYNINSYAKALATGDMHNILFIHNNNSFPLEKADTLNFINDLSSFLDANNYKLIIAKHDEIKRFNYVDAILTYKLSPELFFNIAKLNYVPMIAIDTLISDDLFYNINNNYDNLSNNDNNTYISIPYGDKAINNLLTEKFSTTFINSFEELNNFVNTKTTNVISLSYELYKYLEALNINVQFHNTNSIEKFNAILEATKHAINHENTVHQIKI